MRRSQRSEYGALFVVIVVVQYLPVTSCEPQTCQRVLGGDSVDGTARTVL